MILVDENGNGKCENCEENCVKEETTLTHKEVIERIEAILHDTGALDEHKTQDIQEIFERYFIK